MAGVGRGKRQGWPAAQELDRMRARQVQRLVVPREPERMRVWSVAAAGRAGAQAAAGVGVVGAESGGGRSKGARRRRAGPAAS